MAALGAPLNRVFVAGCGVAVTMVLPARIPPAATAAEQNRAVLVVDTGGEVKQICVRFWEESISGAEMLQRADVDAALRPYAGKGVAVCSLCGTGCRADDSCLTCDPEGRYWAYSRAPAGTSGFRLSGAGASNTAVRNGDVEGWRWSRGASPAYISVAEVCDGAAPPTTTATTAATSTATTAGGQPRTATVPPGGPDPGPYDPRAPSAAPAPATAPNRRPPATGGTASSPSPPSPSATSPMSPTTAALAGAGVPEPAYRPGPATDPASRAPDPGALAARRSAQGDEAGSPAGLLAFAGLLTGLLGWAAWARRRRRTP